MQSFDSNIRSAYFCTKGARARVNFPAVYFLYFVARIAQTPSLLFVDIMKDKTPQTKISKCKLRATGLSEKLLKNGKIRMLGGKRRGGRPKVLNKAAQIV